MPLEWALLVVGATAGLATWAALWPRARGRALGRVAVGLLALGVTLTAAAAWDRARGHSAAEAAAAVRADLPREGRPGGFVSSTACRACHPSQYASWHRSYHRTMTQYATPAAVKAPFDGLPPMRVRGGTVQLERRTGRGPAGDGFFMTSRLGGGDGAGGDGAGRASEREYRIGLVTGSHHMQVFWVPDGRGNRLEMVPYAYLLADRRWVPARDTFLADPRLPFRFDTWNTQCLRCHVTAGQPRGATAAETGAAAVAEALDSRAAEIGIGCESCHGPGEAHVAANASPVRRYAVALAHRGDSTIVNPARLPPRRSAEACGQCHGISGIADPEAFIKEGIGFRPGDDLETYRPAMMPGDPKSAPWLQAALAEDPHFVESRFWGDGVARVIGREWTAMARSACHIKGGMTCLTCHSMHTSDPVDQLAVGAAGDGPCLGCHPKMGADVSAHTHHAAGSEGSRCYNCHMANTTYGLLKATRSHFVETPKVATSRAAGRPNPCNLCHLDRTLAWTGELLARWYGQPAAEGLTEAERTVASSVVHALRGDAAQRALIAWAMSWPPARQASDTGWMASYLVLALGDTYSAIRYLAERGLRAIDGYADLDYDYVAPPDEIEQKIGGAIARWAKLRRPVDDADKRARLLMRPDGSLETDKVGSLVARRIERLLELKE